MELTDLEARAIAEMVYLCGFELRIGEEWIIKDRIRRMKMKEIMELVKQCNKSELRYCINNRISGLKEVYNILNK